MKARKAEIPVLTAKDLETDFERLGLNGSPTQVMKIFSPPKPSGGKIFDGEVNESVSALLKELKGAGLHLSNAEEN